MNNDEWIIYSLSLSDILGNLRKNCQQILQISIIMQISLMKLSRLVVETESASKGYRCATIFFFCMLFDCFQLFRCNFRLLFSLMSNLCTTLAGILNHTCTNSACDSCSELHHRVFSCLTSSDSFRSVPGRQPPPEQRLTIRVVGSLG